MNGPAGFVYILQSDRDQTFYIGSSNNVMRRLAEHNAGEEKYTRLHRPWKLVFSQEYESLSQARRVEYKLKKLRRRDYLKRIIAEKLIKIR